MARPPMRRVKVVSPRYECEPSGSPQCASRRRSQRQNDLASFLAYLKFCRQRPAYNSCFANQLRIFDWVDERRIEMLAEGRPHWVPATHDFEMAERDCWDDLVRP